MGCSLPTGLESRQVPMRSSHGSSGGTTPGSLSPPARTRLPIVPGRPPWIPSGSSASSTCGPSPTITPSSSNPMASNSSLAQPGAVMQKHGSKSTNASMGRSPSSTRGGPYGFATSPWSLGPPRSPRVTIGASRRARRHCTQPGRPGPNGERPAGNPGGLGLIILGSGLQRKP